MKSVNSSRMSAKHWSQASRWTDILQSFVLVVFVTQACPAFSQIIPTNRLANWSLAGVPGGIPNRSTIFVNVLTTTNPSYKCAGDGVTDDSTAIAKAINDCPSNDVVYLPAATYCMANRVYFPSKSYFTLRGDGQGKTIIKDMCKVGQLFAFGQVGGQGNGADKYYSGSNSVGVVSGYTQGSSNLVTALPTLGVLNSGVVFHVGDLVQMSELNDTNVTSFGQNGQQTFSSITSDGQHCLNQMFLITAINNATNLTVWPPVAWNYKSSLSPILYLQDFSHYFFSTCPHGIGFEHLSITNAIGSASEKHVFDLYCAVQSWVYDVEIVDEKNYCGFMGDCLQCQIDGCNFHATSTNTIYYQNYDWETEFSSFVLFQNNIFNGCFEALQIDSGGCGNVVAYNLFTNLYFLDSGVASFAPEMSLSHGAYPMLNLVEGNVGGALQGDFYWGSSGYDTIFRNVFCGVDTAWTGPKNEENNICLKIDASNLCYNVVGNILGTPAITNISCGKPNTWAYMMTGTPGINAAQPVIYRLGYPGIDNDGYTGVNVSNQSLDTNVFGTMIMVENFDYYHNAVQNTTNVALPLSYYLSGKPGWFGNCPWPPFDPNNAAAASVTNIPAGYRFIYGSAPSGGGAQPPVAVIGGSPTSGAAPLTVNFTSTGSYDPGGGTLAYSWTFGDGSSSTAANPSHTYVSAGSYSAHFTVSDGTNQASSSALAITVTNAVTPNQPPVAVAGANPMSGTVPLAVNFSSAGSYDPEGTVLTYSWTFGDGSTSTAANPSHTYQSAGSYSALLTVSDGTNQASSGTLHITGTNAVIANLPPVAVAGVNLTAGAVPLVVNFSSAGSYDPEGATLTYSWTFGDGSTSTAANPSHTYQSAGVYSAQLTVSDGTNQSSSSILTISATVALQANGLVAAYGFGEGSGTTVFDSSGKNNTGTISGATWTTAGRYGGALSFNGSNSVVTVSNSATLNLSSGMTLEAWVYPNALNAQKWMSIIYKPVTTSSTVDFVLHGSSYTTEVPCVGVSLSTTNLSGTSVLPVNTWSHLAGTYNGTNMVLYVNGIVVATEPMSGTIATSSQSLSFGVNWNGLIDEIRIYNYALNPIQIQLDMGTAVVPLAPPPATPTGLTIISQ